MFEITVALVCAITAIAIAMGMWRHSSRLRSRYERLLELDQQRYDTTKRYTASLKYLFEKQQRLVAELLGVYVGNRCAGCNRFRSDRLWCDELQRSTSPSGFCQWHEDKRDEQDNKDQPGTNA